MSTRFTLSFLIVLYKLNSSVITRDGIIGNQREKNKGAEFYIWEVCVYKPCKNTFKSNKY